MEDVDIHHQLIGTVVIAKAVGEAVDAEGFPSALIIVVGISFDTCMSFDQQINSLG